MEPATTQLSNLTLLTSARYTEAKLLGLLSGKMMKFYSAYALLLLTTIFLAFQISSVLPSVPELVSLLTIQALGLLWSFSMLGLSIGILTLLTAAAMSWLQVILLLTGSIDPHLSQAGFFKTLKTFWQQI